MEQKNIKENTEMGEVISTTEAFLEKNKKVLTIAIIAVVVVVLAFFGLMTVSASRSEMLGATLYLAGFENGRELENPLPCVMCNRMINNAGLRVVMNRLGEVQR